MPGLWKAWKANSRLPPLSTSPLEISPTEGEIPTFPQLRPRWRWESGKPRAGFPLSHRLGFTLSKIKTTAGGLRPRPRGGATAPLQWSPFPPPRWSPFIPPLTTPRICNIAQVLAHRFSPVGRQVVRGRKARLMETDPEYVDVIVRRWQEFTGDQAILDPEPLRNGTIRSGCPTLFVSGFRVPAFPEQGFTRRYARTLRARVRDPSALVFWRQAHRTGYRTPFTSSSALSFRPSHFVPLTKGN